MFRAVQLRLAQAGDLSAGFIQQLYLSTASPWDRRADCETAVTQPPGAVPEVALLLQCPLVWLSQNPNPKQAQRGQMVVVIIEHFL